MIIEHAVLNVKSGRRAEFISAMQSAYPIISRQAGFMSFEILPSVEIENQFLLLVRWDSIESHKVGFRGSDDYQKWRALLHHFYDPMPQINYYESNIINV